LWFTGPFICCFAQLTGHEFILSQSSADFKQIISDQIAKLLPPHPALYPDTLKDTRGHASLKERGNEVTPKQSFEESLDGMPLEGFMVSERLPVDESSKQASKMLPIAPSSAHSELKEC
jgi:hypothetical protein